MLRVGIVAEGITDFMVLEEVMRSIHPTIEFDRLHPGKPALASLGQGWTGVRRWCERYGNQLETLLLDVPSLPLHLIVIHVDCSMADQVGAERPCPPPANTAQALTEIVQKSWLQRDPRPEFVVFAAPSKAVEAWIAATFKEPYKNLADIECDKAVEDEFVRRKHANWADEGRKKRPKKLVTKYSLLEAIRQPCSSVATGYVSSTNGDPRDFDLV